MREAGHENLDRKASSAPGEFILRPKGTHRGRRGVVAMPAPTPPPFLVDVLSADDHSDAGVRLLMACERGPSGDVGVVYEAAG